MRNDQPQHDILADYVFLFIPVSFEGTRESAFVSALFAAGISYQVTRDCGRGKIDGCECDNSFQLPKPKANEFRMIGCHENIPFGNAFSRQFISSVELKSKNTARNARSLEDDLVDKHNYEAGRLVRLFYRNIVLPMRYTVHFYPAIHLHIYCTGMSSFEFLN